MGLVACQNVSDENGMFYSNTCPGVNLESGVNLNPTS